MPDFNEIMTERIKRNVQKKVDADFKILCSAFHHFTQKYGPSQSGSCKWLEKSTLENLSNWDGSFKMPPELEDKLFEIEANRVMAAIENANKGREG